MKIRLNEDYYFCCCDWCDSENRILWAKLDEAPSCGACHRPLIMQEMVGFAVTSRIAVGLC